MVSSEATPFCKTGGLADVAGSLPQALAAQGHRVSLFLPFYNQIAKQNLSLREVARVIVPCGAHLKEALILQGQLPDAGPDSQVFFVARQEYFGRDHLYGTVSGAYGDNLERYAFFSMAVCAAAAELELAPHIFHLNDWQCALVAAHLKTTYAQAPGLAKAASIFTIHNLGYQGLHPPWMMPLTGLPASHFNWQGLEFYGQVNLLKAGLVHADALTTVSERYALEIQTPEGGYGLDGLLREKRDRLFGILNGLDTKCWNPARDPLLPARYSIKRMNGKRKCRQQLRQRFSLAGKNPGPLIGIVSRLVEQKGIDLLLQSLPGILKGKADVAILGSGDPAYHQALTRIARAHPGRMGLHLGYDENLAHLVEAGSDIYLMPSRYEPCGLNQMISQRYGTLPLVRDTGGLADTVIDGLNGFSFVDYSSAALLATLQRAEKVFAQARPWRKMVTAAMQLDWSWETSARKYLAVYRKARRLRGLSAVRAPRPASERSTAKSRPPRRHR
jgi:starch synthase